MQWNAVMRVLSALEASAVDYVVIGGMAVNFHGIVRATEALDVFVAPDPENIAKLRNALHSIYDDPSIDEITSQDLCGDYPAVRYVPPGDGPPMDILTRLGDRFRFADLERERYDVDGQEVSVATPATLYRMKVATVRRWIMLMPRNWPRHSISTRRDNERDTLPRRLCDAVAAGARRPISCAV